MTKFLLLFYNKYNTIVNKHAPIKKLSNHKVKQLSKPWMTNGIKAASKVKNKLYAPGHEEHYILPFLTLLPVVSL